METAYTHTQLILMVDDVARNLQILGSILRPHRYSLALAMNGEEALARAREICPDLILLDIMMPGMDGLEVCRRLKEGPKTRDIPVIFLTAKSEPSDIVKGFEAGAVDYVTKPFHAAELLARVRTQLELSKAREDLKAANRARDRFFSIISHDLRAPFASLVSFLKLILNHMETLSREELLTLTGELQKKTESTRKLLENLLLWARLQTDHIEPEISGMSLPEAAADAIGLLRGSADAKQIAIDVPDVPELTVPADLNMISTVLRNLIGNAIKFTRPGGRVSVRAEVHGSMVHVSVQDTGIGMPPEVTARLFRIDEKVTSEGTASEKGSGLGLILCREFISMHGGRLSVTSGPGQGSCFTFTLPLNR